MTTPDRTDAPYYVATRDNRSIHICQMVQGTLPGVADHSRYWLNSSAALWVCLGCHPPVPGASVALAEVGEIIPVDGPYCNFGENMVNLTT